MNPNQDPNFERRLILAFALSVLLFVLVMPFLAKKSPTPPTPAQKPTPVATVSATAPPPPARPVPTTHSKSAAATKAAATKPAAAVAAAAEVQTVVDTPVFRVVFSNRGASVRTWILTQYKDELGKPLDCVDASFSKQFGYPLAFWVSDSGLRQQLDDALYQVSKSTAPGGDQTITFTWSNGTLKAIKKITFNSTYITAIQSSLTRDGQPIEAALAWQGGFGDRAVPGDFKTEQYFQQSGSGVETTKVSKMINDATHQGQYDFAGVEDQYFAMAFLPQNSASLTITTFNNSYQPRLTDATGNTITNEKVATIGLAVATGTKNDTRLFVGPKKAQLLASIDPALREIVNFGWFSFIAYPLFLWMNWTYVHWIPNYGWAILFLTFVITMATFQLKMKSQKSMAKMQALQPKI
ncbi:MAG: membrane protein insertase YidC, partial [Terriglobales bacterium]